MLQIRCCKSGAAKTVLASGKYYLHGKYISLPFVIAFRIQKVSFVYEGTKLVLTNSSKNLDFTRLQRRISMKFCFDSLIRIKFKSKYESLARVLNF
jgi:hypothetical protein